MKKFLALTALLIFFCTAEASAQYPISGRYYGYRSRIGNFRYGTLYTPVGPVYQNSTRIGNFSYGRFYGAYSGYGSSIDVGNFRFYNFQVQPSYDPRLRYSRPLWPGRR